MGKFFVLSFLPKAALWASSLDESNLKNRLGLGGDLRYEGIQVPGYYSW